MNIRQRLRVDPDVVSRQVAGESLLIPVKGRLADMQRIFALNPVAEHIWRQMDGSGDLDSVVRSVVSVFAVDEVRARQDVERFVGQLIQAGLVLDGEAYGANEGSTK